MTPPRVAAVVLAAGLSKRLPENKLLVAVKGEPIVRRVVKGALASRASPVIVVTGNSAEVVRGALAGLPVVLADNRDYAKGLSGSLRCGVRAVPLDCDGVLVLLGDMPFVASALIDALVAAFEPTRGRAICVPVRHGRRGNPVLWGRRFFPELLELEGDRGAKLLLDLHADLLTEVEAGDDGVLIDIDTADDLKVHE